MSYGCGIIILKYILTNRGKWGKKDLRLRVNTLSYFTKHA